MKSINVYLAFENECREAMTFYHSCLGGHVHFNTFGEQPGEIPDESKDLIMHSTLTLGDYSIMASDTLPEHGVPIKGNAIYININCSSPEEIESFYNSMGEGGQIIMALQDTFWGARFGMLTDKFNNNWMFNYELPKVEE